MKKLTPLIFGLLLGLCSCSQEMSVAEPTTPDTQLSQNALELLAMADAHDGTVDLVVEDCVTCMLHMKGKAELAVSLEGYTVHTCNARCQTLMETEAEASLAKLESLEK